MHCAGRSREEGIVIGLGIRTFKFEVPELPHMRVGLGEAEDQQI